MVPRMRIDEIFATAEEPVFSFEFFPPKTEEGEQNLRAALEALRPLEPDFASVTYGAGGSTQNRTLEVTKWLKAELGIEAMAHLSCVGATRDDLCELLDGIAGRGDRERAGAPRRPAPGREPSGARTRAGSSTRPSWRS